MRPSAPALDGFLPADREHLVAEVGGDDRRLAAGGAVVGERQVAGAGAHVENRQRPVRRHEPHRSPPPVAIDAQRQQVIQKIVPPGDLAEHPANAVIDDLSTGMRQDSATESTEDTKPGERYDGPRDVAISLRNIDSGTIARTEWRCMSDMFNVHNLPQNVDRRRSWPAARSS